MSKTRVVYILVHLQRETIDAELKILGDFFETLMPSKCNFEEVTVEVPELPCGKEIGLLPVLGAMRTRSLVIQTTGVTPQCLYLPESHIRQISIGAGVRSVKLDSIDLSSRAMQHLIRTTAVKNSIVTLSLIFCGRHYTLAGLILPNLSLLSIDASYGLSGILTFVMRHQNLKYLTVHDTPPSLDSPLQPQQCFRLPSLRLFRGTIFVFEQLVSKLVEFPPLDTLVLDSDSSSLALEEVNDAKNRQIYLETYDQKLSHWLHAMEVTSLELELPGKAFRNHFGPNWLGRQFTQVERLELRMYDRLFSIKEIAVSGH